MSRARLLSAPLLALGLAGVLSSAALPGCAGDPTSDVHAELVEADSTPVPPQATGVPERLPRAHVQRFHEMTMWTGAPPTPFALEQRSEGARAEALELRATRRAFDGAPPVMPHSADFGRGSKDCIDCHAEGMRLAERVAHPVSHPRVGPCLQCHVESASPVLGPAPRVPSSFQGLRATPAAAARAAGLPPPIPHATWMRNRCLSCHGEMGHTALRIDHPERALCTQCHVQGHDPRAVPPPASH